MCRFALYLGDEITIGSLITEPVNSIIHQSFHSHERVEPLNGDGFGVGWYPVHDPLPAIFKSKNPAWSNRNLRELARVTRTRCLLAHVRAATPPLPVTDLNCHPFSNGRFTFMHNGSLGGFGAVKRALLAGLSDEAFSSIEGSTDSEHVFAVFLDEIRKVDEADPTERMAIALEATINRVEALRRTIAPDAPSLLNLVACDGESAVISRYVSGPLPANTLYVSAGRAYVCEGGVCRMLPTADEKAGSVLVASEPLDEGDHWQRVEPGHMVVVRPDLTTLIRPLGTPAA